MRILSIPDRKTEIISSTRKTVATHGNWKGTFVTLKCKKNLPLIFLNHLLILILIPIDRASNTSISGVGLYSALLLLQEEAAVVDTVTWNKSCNYYDTVLNSWKRFVRSVTLITFVAIKWLLIQSGSKLFNIWPTENSVK